MKRILFLLLLTFLFIGNATAFPPSVVDDPANVAITGGTISGVTVSASSITDTGLTASKPVFTDGSKVLTSTGTLGANQGGTGATTLTDHGVLVGSGTDPVTPLAVGTNGQVLVGSTGADPVFATITDGEGIDSTLGAGTLGIACEDATESNKGILETATDAEAVAVTVTDKAVVPSNLDNVFAAPPATGGTTPAATNSLVTFPVFNGNGTPTAVQLSNTIIRVTATGEIELTNIATGHRFEVLSTTAAVVSVDPVAVMNLNGTALASGNKATSDGSLGASLKCFYDGTILWCRSACGLWIDGGS